MVRIHQGSLKRRSVGVVVARRRGKAEDRVRAPDGPLGMRACMLVGGSTDPCKVWWWWVQLPSWVHSHKEGLMVEGEDVALAWRRSQFNSGWVH